MILAKAAHRRLLLVLALPLLFKLTACAGPGYYAQAIAGHLRLMRQREEVEVILAEGRAEPETLGRLALAREVLQFADRQLALPADGSYTAFVRTGREAVTWIVVAAPELSLAPRRWCFIVAGCVPYRGYFDRDAATRFGERLARDGYDVAISPAVAYSTLGWFEDPLLDTMLSRGDEQTAATLFHELAHQKLYLRGDTAFSESYASLVEDVGVARWLRASGREDRLPSRQARRRAMAQFDDLLLKTREELIRVYGLPDTEDRKRQAKAEVFAQLLEDYRQLVRGEWNGRDYFAEWFTQEPNNARLALFASYRGGICAFADLYRAARGNMERFHALALERASLDDAERRAWLDRPCPAVASPEDL